MGAGMIPDADSVAEFRLITNSFSAEYGKFTGSVMNTRDQVRNQQLPWLGVRVLSQPEDGRDQLLRQHKGRTEAPSVRWGGRRPDLEGQALYFYGLSADPPGGGSQHRSGAGSKQRRTQRHLLRCISSTRLFRAMPGPQLSRAVVAELSTVPVACASHRLARPPCITNWVRDGNHRSHWRSSTSPQHLRLYRPCRQADDVQSFLRRISQAASIMTTRATRDPSSIPTWPSGSTSSITRRATGRFTITTTMRLQSSPSTVDNGCRAIRYPTTQPSRNQLFVAEQHQDHWSYYGQCCAHPVFPLRRSTPRSRLPARRLLPTPSTASIRIPPPVAWSTADLPGYPSSLPPLFFNSFSVGTNWLNLYQPETNYGVGDTVSKTIGNHSLSFGGDFRYYQLNARNTCGPNGYFHFQRHRDERGCFRLLYRRSEPIRPMLNPAARQPHPLRWRSSAQDSWKATPNLVFNYGLRWDVRQAVERCLWPFDHTGSGRAVRQVSQLAPGQPRSGRSRVFRARSLPPAGITLRLVSVSPTRLRAALWGAQVKPAFVRLGVSTTWASRITVTSASLGMLPGASTGRHHSRPTFASPYITRANGVSQGQKFPFTFPSGPGPFPNFSSVTSCPFTCRATTTRTRRRRPSTITYLSSGNSISRLS